VDEAEQARTGLPRTGSFLGWGERTRVGTPSPCQADAEPSVQREGGKISSLGSQFAPQLAAIVATFSPPPLPSPASSRLATTAGDSFRHFTGKRSRATEPKEL